MIVVGIELPVEEVIGGSDAERIAQDRRSTMRCGPQLDNLWTEKDRFVVPVLCPVIESNLFSHPPSCGAGLERLARFSTTLLNREVPSISRKLLP